MRPTKKRTRPRRPSRPTVSARRKRKNMRLDQGLIDAAKQALGLSDETQTVTVALERIIANRRVADGIAEMGGRRILDESRIRD